MLKQMELGMPIGEENRELKQLVADLSLDKAVLQLGYSKDLSGGRRNKKHSIEYIILQ